MKRNNKSFLFIPLAGEQLETLACRISCPHDTPKEMIQNELARTLARKLLDEGYVQTVWRPTPDYINLYAWLRVIKETKTANEDKNGT